MFHGLAALPPARGLLTLCKWTIAVLAVYVLVGLSPSYAAGIYKWTDSSGRIHFSDKPPSKSQSEKIEVKVKVNGYEAPRPGSKQPAHSNKPAPQPVVMYSTTWCGVCKKAKAYFKANSIPYKEYDVEKSSKGRRDYKRLKGRGVPIILVGKQRMNGFSADRFEAMRERADTPSAKQG